MTFDHFPDPYYLWPLTLVINSVFYWVCERPLKGSNSQTCFVSICAIVTDWTMHHRIYQEQAQIFARACDMRLHAYFTLFYFGRSCGRLVIGIAPESCAANAMQPQYILISSFTWPVAQLRRSCNTEKLTSTIIASSR